MSGLTDESMLQVARISASPLLRKLITNGHGPLARRLASIKTGIEHGIKLSPQETQAIADTQYAPDDYGTCQDGEINFYWEK